MRRARNCPPRGSVWKDRNALFLASVYFASDLSLGGVLLFPIDDKESRNEGQDLVSKKKKTKNQKNPSLTGTKIRLPPEAAPAPTGPSGGLCVARVATECHRPGGSQTVTSTLSSRAPSCVPASVHVSAPCEDTGQAASAPPERPRLARSPDAVTGRSAEG